MKVFADPADGSCVLTHYKFLTKPLCNRSIDIFPTIIHHQIFLKKMSKVYMLDYVAGNVRSLVNAIEKVGYTVEWIKSPEDVEKADVSK